MAASPTSRSLALLKERGYTAGVVEKWVPMDTAKGKGGIRRDLFGCLDIVAVSETGGTIGVQACAVSGQAAHVAKVLAEPRARTWLLAGNRLVIWAWRKYKKPENRRYWRMNETEITLEMFNYNHAELTEGNLDTAP